MAEVAEKPAAKPALKQFKITFHSGEEGQETADVVLGWNGQLNRYQRNVQTTIDENFLGVLKDAVIHTETQNADGTKTAVTIPRFSYSVEPA